MKAIDSSAHGQGGGATDLRLHAVADLDVRPPPHALGPEKSLLSTMLQDPQEYIGRAVEERLTRGHFYFPAHSLLFGELIDLYDRREPIELVSLAQRLNDRGLLDKVGGLGGLSDLYTYAPSPGHFLHHLKMVKDKFILRSIIHHSGDAIAQAYDSPDEVESLLDTVESGIMAIRQGAEVNRSPGMTQLIDEFQQYFHRMVTVREDPNALFTGFKKLDRLCTGLKPGEMFVVAARPAVGKTSFMMNIVEHIAIDLGKPTMVFSCEMTAAQIVQRLVFARSRFDAKQLQNNFQPSKQDLRRITTTCAEILQAKLFIDDTPGISINELRAKARRRKIEDDIGFIAIDYLQLLRSRTRQAENSREREVAEISAGIKNLAKELNLPILVLAQLNRGPEERKGARHGQPRKSDLRESGSNEQDADLVGLLYRDSYYQQENQNEGDVPTQEDQGTAALFLAKNRHGGTGEVKLTFTHSLMRFQSADAPDQPDG